MIIHVWSTCDFSLDKFGVLILTNFAQTWVNFFVLAVKYTPGGSWDCAYLPLSLFESNYTKKNSIE
jgi:hypothetical protein